MCIRDSCTRPWQSCKHTLGRPHAVVTSRYETTICVGSFRKKMEHILHARSLLCFAKRRSAMIQAAVEPNVYLLESRQKKWHLSLHRSTFPCREAGRHPKGFQKATTLVNLFWLCGAPFYHFSCFGHRFAKQSLCQYHPALLQYNPTHSLPLFISILDSLILYMCHSNVCQSCEYS